MPYITENGEVGHDEVNRVVAGGNYGNPVAEGYAQKPGIHRSGLGDRRREAVRRVARRSTRAPRCPSTQGDFFFCSYNTGDLTRMRFGGPNFDQIVAQRC